MENNELPVAKVIVFDETIELEYNFTQDLQEEDMRGEDN